MNNFFFNFFNFFNFNGGFFLPLICFLPLVAIFFLLPVSRTNYRQLKFQATVSSLFIFVFSLSFYFGFDVTKVNFQYFYCFYWFPSLNTHIPYGLDGLSLFFFLLTSFLIPVCILSSLESLKFRLKEFFILFFFVEFLLFNVFCVVDLFWFYVFFEGSLIPMFIIIGVWGSRSRRIAASYQFFLYTFAGSLLFLLAILFIQINFGSTDFFFLQRFDFSENLQLILWLAFFISFAVKVPMIPVHVWLPEAHVEAPTAGSILLAGILLKLGGYGFIRFSIPFFPYACEFFAPLVFTIGVVSVIYSSCTTLRQIDLKKIIAYTSVAHMNLVVIGIFVQNIYGLEGAIVLMLAHGLVSTALFFIVGSLYDRYGTRLLRYYGGLVNLMPLFSFYFFIFSLANMGLPGTVSFVGEFLIFLGTFFSNTLVVFLSSTSVIFSAAYSVWLSNRLLFGPLKIYVNFYADFNFRENFILFLLASMVIFFGIFPNFILDCLHISCTNLILSVENWNFSATFWMFQDEYEEIVNKIWGHITPEGYHTYEDNTVYVYNHVFDFDYHRQKLCF